MSFKLPNQDQLRRIGAGLGMDITADYADAVIDFIKPVAEGYRMMAAMADELPPVKYPRGGFYRPEGDENKYGAWIVKTSIKGAKSGKLAGKKVAVKDTYLVAGMPATNGASILEGYVPEFDATVVTRLLDAGAEFVGKTVCEYFSFSGGSATGTTGPVINPRVPGHSPGGSSTGSAAVVAAGEVDMATGCDQAGSIRIPASLSGVVGLKPTWGLVPYTGIMAMDPTIDHTGPLTATVAENALFLEAMAGPDGLDPRQAGAKVDAYTKAIGKNVKGLKIAVVREGFGQPDSHPDVDAAVRASAEEFARLGAAVSEIEIPWHLKAVPLWGAITLEGTYHALFHGAGVGHHTEGVYPISLAARLASIRDRANELPHTMKVSMLLAGYTDQQYQGYFYFKAQNLRRRLRAAYEAALADHDLLLMPTTRSMAPKIPPVDAALPVIMEHSWYQIGNTCPFNLTGHPAISIPCGLGAGERPIGLMLIGKHWQESTIYRAADAFERAVDWQKKGSRRGKG